MESGRKGLSLIFLTCSFRLAARSAKARNVIPLASQPVSSLSRCLQLLVLERQHAAVCVLNDEERLCTQERVGDDQGSQGVVRDEAACVPDDVCVPGLEPEHRLDGQTGVHAGNDCQLLGRSYRQVAEVEPGSVSGVGLKGVGVDRHRGDLLSRSEGALDGRWI